MKGNNKLSRDDYDSITTLQGLAAIRKRPGMYVGSPQSLDGKNPNALIQIAQEALSNAIDEAYAGYGDEISMIIHEDNSITVKDKGRGLPKGDNYDDAIRALTVLHSSGKFDSSNYASAIGQNGIGIKACTALSKWLSVDVVTTKKEHYFIKVEQENVVEKKKLPYDENEHTGTTITFLPDDTIFDTINWDDQILINKIEQSSFLTPKVKFNFIDERKEGEDGEQYYTKSWYSKNGMPDYVEYIGKSETLISGLKKPISFKGTYDNGKGESIDVEGALSYTESSGETILSFANGAPTIDGGPHVDGAKLAIYKAFSDYGKANKLFKKGKSIDASDTRDGLILSLLVKIPESILMFESQSKTKLATVDAKNAAKDIIYEQVTNWLYDHNNLAKKIINNMIDSSEARKAAINAKKAAKKARETKKDGGKLIVSSKLSPASSKKSELKSLFISEGDSANASLTLVRDKKYQATFPIRGKMLNVINEKLSRVLKNEEISTIASVLGAGIGPAFDEKDLEYNKILITSDADDDGAHIANLLITLFYKLFPGLIENGHLYRVISPLYHIGLKNKDGKIKEELAYTESEYDELMDRVHKDEEEGYKVQFQNRYKGLGSLSKEATKKFIADPATRKLQRITVDNAEEAKEALQLWMGNNSDERRDRIMNEIDFNEVKID